MCAKFGANQSSSFQVYKHDPANLVDRYICLYIYTELQKNITFLNKYTFKNLFNRNKQNIDQYIIDLFVKLGIIKNC